MTRLSYNRDYALNAVCPYFTMFPLEYPIEILKKAEATDIVLDPFCGRGTTNYAARRLNLPSYGIDASPVAVAIANAKIQRINILETLKLAEEMLIECPKNIPDSMFFKIAYEKNTLAEICSIREGLLKFCKPTESSTMLRAIMLGCLQGPLSKSLSNAAYFSNQMPRTFAPKPNYSIKFWRENNYSAPRIGILSVLKRKLSLIGDTSNDVIPIGSIVLGDSRSEDSFTKIPNNFSVVITSPPYYGMRTYLQDQWLRNWFVGGPSDINYNTDLQVKHSKHGFVKELASVWKNISESKSDKLDLYIRFGGLPSIKSNPKDLLISSIEEATKLKILSVAEASVTTGARRQAIQMGCSSKASIEYDFHVIRS